MQTFNNTENKAAKNIVQKGKNAGYQHFLLFPQCFLSFPWRISILESPLIYLLHLVWTSLKLFFFLQRVNSPPDDKLLTSSKLKAFTDDNCTVAQMVQLLFNRIEDIVGKGGHADDQNFRFFFSQCFRRLFP